MPSLPFLLPLPVETKDKETDMRCPECNNEVNEKEQQCPHCGAPLHHEDRDDEPTLGRGMVAFIIIGTVFLVAFGFFYYSQHKNDPEYTQTAIEPDSNLADNDKAKFDTIARDTTAKDSTDSQEEEQAEKVFNSIRGRDRAYHKVRHDESSAAAPDDQAGASEGTSSSSGDPQPIAPAASKPRVETIETE